MFVITILCFVSLLPPPPQGRNFPMKRWRQPVQRFDELCHLNLMRFRRIIAKQFSMPPKPWAQCYKTTYIRNLPLLVISQSVCPLLPNLMSADKAGTYPELCFTRVGSGLAHKLDRLGWRGLARNEHSSLLRKILIYGPKMFYDIGPGLSFGQNRAAAF